MKKHFLYLNSYYSTSNVASDMLVMFYQNLFIVNTVIMNCSNKYSLKQYDKKQISTIIINAIHISIDSDGKNIWGWLNVLDYCKRIALFYKKSKTGKFYNKGNRNERNSNFITNSIDEVLDSLKQRINGSYKEHITYTEDSVRWNDKRFIIDRTKILNEFDWQVDKNLQSVIVKSN